MTKDELKSLLPEYLLNSETYSLVITDLEGRYIYVNEVFNKRFSFISDNFIGQDSLIAIYPEDHQKCLKAVEQSLANPDKVVKVLLRKPDTRLNDFYWTEWEFSVFKDLHKNPIGILCLGHDLTETERVSKLARDFAQKVEKIIEEIPEGFYQLNREWSFVKVNKIAEQILGMPREQLLGRSIWDLFPDTDAYHYPAQFRRAMAENIPVTFEYYCSELGTWFSAVAYPSTEGLTIFFRDITKQKLDAIALQESENKLRAIFDSTPDSNLFISPDKKILNFNKSAYEIILRFTRKPLELGADVEDFVLQEDKPIFNTYFPKALAGETHIIELERELEKQKIWLEVTYMPVYDKNNTIIGVSINSKDITDKKQAEIKLQEKEYMLRAIYQSTLEASIFIDKNFIIRYCNQVAKNVTKQVFGKEVQVGDNSLDYYQPEYQADFKEFYQRALSGENIVVERSDSIHWWQINLYPVYDEQQNIIGLANVTRDITNRKTKELQLQESEDKLEKTIEAIPHPLLIFDENLTISYANDEFEKVFGYTESEVLGKQADFLLPERLRAGHVFLQKSYMQEGGKLIRRRDGALPALTKSGQEILINASLNNFYANGKKFVIIILQDVTELEKRQHKILEQNLVLREIAWQQSHEVRRPLANILGLCYLLKNYKNESEEIKNQYVEHILQAAQELDEVIHKIVGRANENI